MASIILAIVTFLFVSTKANPLQQTYIPDDMEEPLPSLIDDIRYPDGMETRQAVDFSRYPASRWPNNTIPYSISFWDFTSSQKNTIKAAINEMNTKLGGCPKIVERTRQSDYVMVISGNGCYSYLGRTGGQQTLSLQRNGCLSKGTIQHEFEHAFGFTHEMNRPDRDDHVSILWENISPEWRSQYEKASEDDFDSVREYEFYSVMHYPMNAPGSNKPAFEILDAGIDESRLGQRDGLTDLDVQKVRDLYGC